MTHEEHDEVLLGMERNISTSQRALEVAERRLRLSAHQRRLRGSWTLSDGSPGTLEAALVDRDDTEPPVEAFMLAETTLENLWAEVHAHEAGYTGWTRYRLVVSSDGHVHADNKCRSFRETTKTVVIPPLSGKDPTAAVEMLGNACCSVCMPGTEGKLERVPASLVNVLLKRGTAAFREALNKRKARTRH